MLINGRAYDWASIRLNLLGRTVAGITAIQYGDKQEKVNNYGAGINPVSRGYGKYEGNASITLEMKEVVAILNAIPGKRLQDIAMFNINISYMNDSNQVVNEQLVDCEFLERKIDVKTGDTNIEIELPLIISEVKTL